MESLPFNLRRRVNLSSMEKTLEFILQFGNYVNTAYDAEQFTVEVVGSLRDNLIIPDNWDYWDDSNMDFLFEYLYNIWEEYLKEYYNDVKGDDSISEEVSRIKEVMGVLNEDFDKKIRRRIDFGVLKNLVNKFKDSAIDFDGVYSLNTMAMNLSGKVADELLGGRELRKFDNEETYQEIKNFIYDVYGKELKLYFADQLEKHKEKD
jgi:hypothetical protein